MTTDAAVEQYKKKRSPEELDLIGEVRKVLNDNGLGNQVKEVFDNDPRIIEAKDKVPEVQRHLLNKFWLPQLLNSSAPSQEERFCLIPNGEPKEWLHLFKEKIVPFVIEQQLPVAFK